MSDISLVHLILGSDKNMQRISSVQTRGQARTQRKVYDVNLPHAICSVHNLKASKQPQEEGMEGERARRGAAEAHSFPTL